MNLKRPELKEEIEQAAAIISASRHLVALTGAGCSTESGIPDFRSSGGLWKKYDPAIYADYAYFLKDPSKHWELNLDLMPLLENAKPNNAHLALVELEKAGLLKALITQNIDNLHQKAGCHTIIELHGNYREASCLNCRQCYDLDEIRNLPLRPFPHCPRCQGIIKPKVVLFGEALDSNVLARAKNEVEKADVLLIIGTALEIFPAALLPQIAKQHGARLIIVNPERTKARGRSDIFLRGKAGEILPKILSHIKGK